MSDEISARTIELARTNPEFRGKLCDLVRDRMTMYDPTSDEFALLQAILRDLEHLT